MNRHAREYFGLKHINLVAPPEQRPVCQYCERPLKPKLHWPPVWAGKGEPRYPILLTEPPPGALAWGRFRDFEVQVWLGEYQGYGRDEMGVPLFCRLRCGFAFAQVMYRGGERVQRDGRVIQRYQPSGRRGWVFKSEDGGRELGFAAAEEYLDAEQALRDFSRGTVEHFGVWFETMDGTQHPCADDSTPEDFPEPAEQDEDA